VHEYHILEKLVKEALAGEDRRGVVEIFLSVSESSGLDPDSIKLYFEDLRPEYPQLKDAGLNIKLTKVKLHCPKCNLDFERQKNSFSCPKCFSESQRSSLHKDISIEKITFRS
jgi:hydrogenase nickel incorporation protein HypA/HybF